MIGDDSEGAYRRLREELIIGLYADDKLAATLVLKGGNALNVVHHIGQRTSLDIDCSISEPSPNTEFLGERIFGALRARLAPLGLAVFDTRFGPRPHNANELADPSWGGYVAEFKLADTMRLGPAAESLDQVRRSARTITPNQQSSRVFEIQLSKNEYCLSIEEKLVGGFTIRVYTPQAIAAEKLRAICQQIPGGRRKKRTPRARDSYDIHALATQAHVDLGSSENLELIRKMFAIKDVPLRLLAEIVDHREFHRAEWPKVMDAVGGGRLMDYDFYFDFVVDQIRPLESLWIVDSP